MARFFSRFATAATCVAALSMAATPAMARGWGGHGGYRHHDRVSGGDILAGVLILGGIAAIASAASKDNNRDDDYRYRAPYPDNGSTYRPEYRERSGYTGGGIDNAVNMCVGEVERGNARVAAVDNARRTADGWQISGQLDAGGGFDCAIDNDGRIRNVDIGGQASSDGSYDDGPGYDGTGPDNRPEWNGADAGQAADGQWDDDSYARARDDIGYAQP